MVIWDDAQQNCKDLASDTTSASLTFFKRLMNTGYKLLLADLGRPQTERIQTANSVASQQFYQMPPDFLYPKSITFTVSSIAYPVQEEPSQEIWDYVNARSSQTASIPELYFVRQGFGFSGNEIGFYPIPASAGTNNITIIYEASDRDLATDKYTTGTVAVTSGSATVTGTSTTFTAAMVGRYFNITDATGDGLFYRVASYTSTTVVVLENVYEGATLSGAAYQIAEVFNLPEEMQILPCYFSLAHFFGIKKDTTQETKYWTLFNTGLEAAKRRHGTKTRSAIVGGRGFFSRWSAWAPGYFPAQAS